MNLDTVCRTCLRVPQRPYDLFSDGFNLLEKIETISSVVIEDVPELPKQICEECFAHINTFYRFRKVILNTDRDLKTRLETLNKTNYTSKPRTKNLNDEMLELKREPSPLAAPPSDSEPIVVSEDDSEADTDNLDFIKALAMKKIFRCRTCKQVFSSRIRLVNHKRTVHAVRGICNICGITTRFDNLRKHIRLHSETPAECVTCHKVFKNSESLRTHRLVHVEISHTCEICGKSFRLKGEHTRHLKQHENPDLRKKTCRLCGKRVRDQKRHMLTHTGERPYTCDGCDKGFTSGYALKVHKRQHTNEKPFTCSFCNADFSQKVSLVTHLKSKHGVT